MFKDKIKDREWNLAQQISPIEGTSKHGRFANDFYTPTKTKEQEIAEYQANLEREMIANQEIKESDKTMMGNIKHGLWKGLTGFNAGLMDTVDFILPDAITPTFIQKGLDYYDVADRVAAHKSEKIGTTKGQKLAGELAAATSGGYKTRKEDANIDGNYSVNQKEAKQYLDGQNMSREEKRMWWFILTGGAAKNNPY